MLFPEDLDSRTIESQKSWLIAWPSGIQIRVYAEKESENIFWRQINSVMGGIKESKNHQEVMNGGMHGGPSQPMDYNCDELLG